MALGPKRTPCTSGTGERFCAHRRPLAHTAFPHGKQCENEPLPGQHGPLPQKPSMRQAAMDSATGLCGWRDGSSSGGSGSVRTPLRVNEAPGVIPCPRMASSLPPFNETHVGCERLGSREEARGAAREGTCMQLEGPRSPASQPGHAGSAPRAPFPGGHPASGSALSQPWNHTQATRGALPRGNVAPRMGWVARQA